MRRSEARIALEAARQWEGKGMFRNGAFAHLEKSLSIAAAEGQPGLAMQSFFTMGGVMLGAATAALYGLLELNGLLGRAEATAWLFFASWSFILLMAAVALHLTRQRELGDALIIAGLVPTAILLGPTAPLGPALHGIPILVGAAILAWRRGAHLVPLVAFALANVAIPIFLFRTFDSGFGEFETASVVWLLMASLVFIGTMLSRNYWSLDWANQAAVGATAGVIFSWISVVFSVIEPSFDGGYETLIALGLAVLIGTGIGLKDPLVTFVAGIALAIDAIIFAFDIGGLTTGLLVLLALAIGLITLASVLRKRRLTAASSRTGVS